MKKTQRSLSIHSLSLKPSHLCYMFPFRFSLWIVLCILLGSVLQVQRNHCVTVLKLSLTLQFLFCVWISCILLFYLCFIYVLYSFLCVALVAFLKYVLYLYCFVFEGAWLVTQQVPPASLLQNLIQAEIVSSKQDHSLHR